MCGFAIASWQHCPHVMFSHSWMALPGGNDVPPGFPEDEEWMEDENGHQVP
jgi:hypothetical protein